jgi:hypothetical protein
MLGACSEQSPVTPNAGPPLFGSIPGGVGSLSASSAPTQELFKVCKVYSGAVGPAVTVNVQVDVGNNGGAADHDFNVTIADGECWDVWSSSGNAGVTDLVTVTETVPGGYEASFVTQRRTDGVNAAPDASVVGFTTSETITNPSGPGPDGIVVTFTNTEIPDEGCTLTQGFWKTHTGLGPQADAWPALPGGTMTLGTVAYTKAQLISILNAPVKGNGLISLAHQLIAANLNILNGASATDISASITAANTLIGALIVPPVGSGFLAPSAVSSLVGALADFNEGETGPGHCDELEPII